MLRHHLIVAFRNLVKHKASSFINIGGLTLGLTTGLLIMLIVLQEFSYDKFQPNLPDLYLLMKNQKNADGISTGSATAGPMAATLRTDIPGTKSAARVAYFGGEPVRVKDQVLTASGIYTEPELFRMMSFPSLQGDARAALENGSQVVITESAAKKFFGSTQAMGMPVTLDKQAFTVGAILKDIPAASSIQLEIAFPFSYYEKNNSWLQKWDDNRIHTFVRLNNKVNVAAIDKKLTDILQMRSDDKTVSLFLYPMARMHLYNGFENGQQHGGKIDLMILLMALAAFVILIACVNFMNIATARSQQRSREVGIRKTLGASRGRIMLQFLGEAMTTTFCALLLSIILARLTAPWLALQIGKPIEMPFGQASLWYMLASVGIVTGLVAGSYPALFLSRFKPVQVLKTAFSTRKGGGLRKALVTFQFILSVTLIVSTIIIYKQVSYIRSRPIGYEQKNILDIRTGGDLAGKYNLFKHALSRLPGVQNTTAGSDDVINFGGAVTGMDYPGKKPGQEIAVIVSGIGYDWTKTLKIPIVEGRDFSPEFATDSNACIINEAAVRKMELKAPVIGQTVGGKKVIGICKDFVYNNPSGIIAPMMLMLQEKNFGHFFVRIDPGQDRQKTLAGIQALVHTLNPDYPVDYVFMQEAYERRFEEWDSFSFLVTIFSSMAIFIACLGLLGLASFIAERRGKEISIRKVFGANSTRIWWILSNDFLKPVMIALLVVIPASAWLAHTALANITYHTPLSWWIFALAGFITLTLALATTGIQAVKAAITNPATTLRAE